MVLAGLVMLALVVLKRRAHTEKELRIRDEIDGAYGQMDPNDIEICKRADGSEWLLGSGSFAKVYKGLRSKVQEVAVKKLAWQSTPDMRLLVKEVDILKKVSFYRNIVQY